MKAADLNVLAIEGGTPVRRVMLPYGRQCIEPRDVQVVVDTLKGDWLTTGPLIARFERRFAEWLRVPEAVAVSSGTAALHAAVFSAGFGPGDEIITTPLTFVATANCVLYVGAKPVFADIDSGTLCIDPIEVERAVTPRTRGIIAMHYAGQPCDMRELRGIAERRGLVLIEDACHAIGARDHGETAGTLGDLACFSFHPVKHLTTGEGGMVTTGNTQWASRMRAFRNHGIETDARTREQDGTWVTDMRYLGHNYRLTDFQCALGMRQLEAVDDWTARRRQLAARYMNRLDDFDALQIPHVRQGASSSWHLFPVLLRLDRLRVGRAEVFRAMRAENIGVNVHYPPVHLHSYYRERFGFRPGAFPRAELAYERLLSLPLFPRMTDEDIDDVVKALRKVIARFSG